MKTSKSLFAMLAAAFAALSVPVCSFAEVGWTSGVCDHANWLPASDNVLGTATVTNGLSYYNENGKTMAQNKNPSEAMSALRDGRVVDGFGGAVGIAGGWLVYQLNDIVDLDSIAFYTYWGDGGRDGISISQISVSKDGEDWTTVGGGSCSVGIGDNDSSKNGLYAKLSDTGNEKIATDVGYIKIEFGAQDNNGTGYCEIEACGSAVNMPAVTIVPETLQPWAATLSGTVTSLGGGSSAELYFAYGTDASALNPQKEISDLSEGETFKLQLSGLNDSTVYHYAYYISVAGLGDSIVKNGSFTTGYAEPVAMTACAGMRTRSSARIEYTVKSLGEQGTKADVYFAYGTSETLEPTWNTSVTSVGPGKIELSGLEPATTYRYAIYAKNQLGRFCPTITGSFRTNDDSNTPKWTGAVSSKWSEPGNWDPATTLADFAEVAQVVLVAYEGAYEPSELDVQGLDIYEIRFGAGGKSSFSMGGLPVSLRYFSAEEGSASTLTINNEVNFPAKECLGSFNGNRVRFAGIVHGPAEGEVTFKTSGNDSHAYFLNPSNDFRGKLVAHVGGIHFTCEGALGAVPEDVPESPNVYREHNGAVYVEAIEGKDLNIVELGPTRYIAGGVHVAPGTELVLGGPIHNALDLVGGGSRQSRVVIAGTSVSGESDFSAELAIGSGIAGILKSASFAADSTRSVSCASGSFDLNGYSFSGRLTNYGYGIDDGDPLFVNTDRESMSTLTGLVAPHPSIGNTDIFFGGAGDIRVECPVTVRTVPGRDSNHFRKTGQGTLTLAGAQGTWTGYSMFLGGFTLDYTSDNGPKLPSGLTGVTHGHGRFEIIGHPTEKTTCELSSVTLSGGLTEFVTKPGAGGLRVELNSVSYGGRDRAIDFQIGEGTEFSIADASNDANFKGLWTSATWNRGEAWACALGDGRIGPMNESTLDTKYAESGTVWMFRSGSTTVGHGGTPYGILVSAPEGSATINLGSVVDILKVGAGEVAGVLISSKCAGDVTIQGGELKVENWNGATAIHNWNTNGVVRISSLMPETNDNDCWVFGPGTTVIDNDSNSYYYGPNVSGGGTVRFTSVADRDVASALGKGKNSDGAISLGHGTSFEYVGTVASGHTTNRRLVLYGDVTLKADGEGPLVMNNAIAIARADKFSCARLILDGDEGKAGGVLDGGIHAGSFGSVVKRGTGTWTLNATNSAYGCATEIEEGRFVLNGSLPGDVVVRGGATLVLGEGAVIAGSLSLEPGATVVIDPVADAPVVKGIAELGGTLAFTQRLPQGRRKSLLVAENGLRGAFAAVPSGLRLAISGTDLLAERPAGVKITLR